MPEAALPESFTHRVIRFVRTMTWEDIPEPVRHQAKRCLLDALGALLGGTRTPVAGLMANLAADTFPGEEATILGFNRRVSFPGAALANGFSGNALDIDDGYRRVKGHPGACILPVVLAAGETAGCSGREILTALAAGYEVAIRAGLIRHATYPVYHSSGSWGAVAGAAVAGRILGLSPGTMIHAMGAAEYHAPIAPMMKGIETPSMGKDSIGWGCFVAALSVRMAEAGFTGIRPLFDDTPEPDWIDSLGRDWEILNLYFKPYAACRWAQAPMDGALAIVRENGIRPEDIARIGVATFAEAVALSRKAPATTEDAQYNLSFPIAAVLLDGDVGPDQVLPPRLFDADIRSLMDRITVSAEERFQREFPDRALAEVTIETGDGRRYTSGVLSAGWDPASRLPTDQELEAKFFRLTVPVLGKGRAEDLAALVWDFHNVDHVGALISASRAGVP